MAVRSFFTAHPAEAGETYGEHFRVAMGFSRQLFGAGLAAAIHALAPNFHTTTASDKIRCLNACLESGHRDGLATHAETTVPGTPPDGSPTLSEPATTVSGTAA